ncbi:MAG: radical SAM protein [Rhizobiales bacterium]|nr:radical SAM protein [Hyphomicrobiales bacterium]NRB14370.1 radical SAM protein [Hyphomicrobiales bacterium]
MLTTDKNSPALATQKFRNPDFTAKGDERATVSLTKLDTLWVNTGTLCNITCENCYIFSSPTNDDLQYFTATELQSLIDEIKTQKLATREIGFTGGEPFMNPQMNEMIKMALSHGFEVLVLTNATQPLLRPNVKQELLKIKREFGDKLTLRVSLDHHSAEYHDKERGLGNFTKALEGIDWLSQNGFKLNIAARSIWNEDETTARDAFAALFKARNYQIDAYSGAELVIFPEMDEQVDVPEITTECWDILGLDPTDIMCASSRMVVHRKGEDNMKIVPCTLIAFDEEFDMGTSLKQSLTANGGNFKGGAVKLNHQHCAKFCVLGGGSCSA